MFTATLGWFIRLPEEQVSFVLLPSHTSNHTIKAIILATIGSQIFGIDEILEPLAIIGILIVISGIGLLCYDTISKTDHPVDMDQIFDEECSNNASSHPPENDVELTVVSPMSGNFSLLGYEQLEDAPLCYSDNPEEAFSDTLPFEIVDNPREFVIQPPNESEQLDMIDGLSLNPHEVDETKTNEPPHSRTSYPQLFSSEWFNARKKLFASVGYAIGVGTCTATYSIVDAMGVQIVPSPLWAFLYNFISNPCLMPFLYIYFHEESIVAIKEHKRSIIIIAPCVVGAYLIILVVFSMPGVDVALVVTLREFAVLIGALFGVAFLKERYSWIKFTAIILMLMGMILLKFA